MKTQFFKNEYFVLSFFLSLKKKKKKTHFLEMFSYIIFWDFSYYTFISKKNK